MRAHRYGMRACSAAALAGALLLVGATSVTAQQANTRWLAFVGCWEPMGEGADRGILCIEQADQGVELYTVVDGEVTTSDLMVANGEQRSTSIEGCEGWEAAEFSQDGRRVFTRSEFVCGGDVPRTSTGVMSLVAPTQWLDVRSVDIEGDQVAWVQRYRLVGPERMLEEGVDDFTQDLGMALRATRIAASRRVDLAQVEEAANRVDAKAVEAWIAARKERLDIDADALVSLADAGVAESIIDVVVAVSYPESFTIDAEALAATRDWSGAGGLVRPRYGLGARSFFWNPFYYGYSPYSSRYGLGLGYGYGGYGGYYYTPTTVIVDRQAESGGRVYNGRGYRQGGGSSSAGAPRSSGGGGSSVAPSRGGSSSGGRTARRRGGGGF